MLAKRRRACVIQLTPPGRGAVATLRIEGVGAVDAVQFHFRARSGRPLAAYPADRLVVGHFGPDRGEEVVVRRCVDDAVELHCHGGFAAVARIEEALIAAGCQTLAWRDWAANANVDPVAAAALAALADARTERTAAILLDQYHGALGRDLGEIRQAIDRGDDDAARRQIDALLGRANLGRHLLQPWRVVLAGPVNVGKSSLLNALAGYGRSIVHPGPGTTRDAVALPTAIDGWPVELCDTAGLRAGGDPVERAGIERARERLAQADLAILVFDQSVAWSAEDGALVSQWPGALLVHNKCDLPAAPGDRPLVDCPHRYYQSGATAGLSSSAGNTGGQATRGTRKLNLDRPLGLPTSALQAFGIEELLDAIAGRLVPDPPPAGAAVPFTDEQIVAVQLQLQRLPPPYRAH